MKNHHATLTSDRLQDALALLSDRQYHTSLEVANAARTTAPGSTISELRSNGVDVSCRYKGTIDGRKIFEYKLT